MPIASRAAADRSTAFLYGLHRRPFLCKVLSHRLPSSDRNMRERERRKSRIVSGEKLICSRSQPMIMNAKLSMEEVNGILVR